MITIYSICFNEEIILDFMIGHYRRRFPDCEIVIIDNESTDRTIKIARDRECVIVPFTTKKKMDDQRMCDLKNHIWKRARTDWVLVCDADELLDIDETALKMEGVAGTTIITSFGFNMVNMKDNYDLGAITHGSSSHLYSKSYLFKKTKVQEINYAPGAHTANPVGSVVPSRKRYFAYHYRHIHPELSFEKQERLRARMSETNLQNGWCYQYMQNRSLEDFRLEYKIERATAQRVRIPDSIRCALEVAKNA